MEAETWVFRVEPHPEESLGHFLGRFRRANHLNHKMISGHLGVRLGWVEDWEMPSRRRNPTTLQLIALSKLVEVDPNQLAAMLPPDPLHLQTRLCVACYGEVPVHRAAWQRGGTSLCDRHQTPLLTACPNCGSGFRLPALWDNESCEQCGLALSEMTSSNGDRGSSIG
jgi:TniQ